MDFFKRKSFYSMVSELNSSMNVDDTGEYEEQVFALGKFLLLPPFP